MNDRDRTTRSIDISAVVACLVGMTIVAIIDFSTNVSYNAAIAYSAIVVLGAWTRLARFVWLLALTAIVLTFADLFLGRALLPETQFYAVAFNRSLVSVEVLCAAAIVHLWIRAMRRLERGRDEIQQQHDLVRQREEEIARQNEALQSQTEELERQGEELRLANDELARRERHLQALLDLSRSLTAGLTQDEAMGRICSALAQLVDHNPAAAAILERKGDELHIRCHHGLTGESVAQAPIPFEKSFTRLVIERNQTGYLEDLSLRPDLVVPRGTEHGPARAILAAPLRARGTAMGSVEVYSPNKQSWTEEQIALVESLAAQASVTLDSATLFEEIDRQRRRFETVFDTLPIGVAVANADRTDIRVNGAGAAMMNLPTDANLAVPEMSSRYEIYGESRPLSRQRYPLMRALQGELVQNEEIEVVLPGGRRLVMLVSAGPIRTREGGIIGAVSAFVDVTTMKDLQRELMTRRREAEEASVRKTRFLAAVSHDIRTPTNAINLMAELMRRTASNPAMASQIPEMAGELQASAATLVELVSDVLDVARFDSGRIDVQESEFALGELLVDENRHLLPLAEQKGLALEVERPQPPIWLRTDRIKLGRILANLVSNAIKFTRQGKVRVGTRLAPDGGVELWVADTGIGIAVADQSNIFDEFYQLRNPERDRNKGSGLGLAICKRLTDALGGSIGVSSVPGQGSTFTVYLPPSAVVPRSASAEAMARESMPAQRSIAGLRVLLVEDHDGTRLATAQLLRNEGAVVLDTPSGQDALRLLEREQPGVMLLDLMLPDLDGREILRRLRETGRPAFLKCLIILTGDLLATEKSTLRQMGADLVLAKPINVGMLLDQIALLACDGAKPAD